MHILQFIQLLTFYNLSVTSNLKSGFITSYDNCPGPLMFFYVLLTESNSVFVLYGISGSQCRKKKKSIVLMSQRNDSVLSWVKDYLLLTLNPGFQRFLPWL